MENQLLTVRKVAAILKCSDDAASDQFAKVPGVINLSQPGMRRHLRIPLTVLEAYLSKKAVKTVTVSVVGLPERRRRHDGWENKAVLNLAKAARQNGITQGHDRKMSQKVLAAIAEKAAYLARAIPEPMWQEVLDVWTDDEEE